MSEKKEQKLGRFRKYLRDNLDGWKNVSDQEMDFQLFTSITNDVYKVTAKGDDVKPNPVIFRNFQGSDEIIDKDKEVKVFNELSRVGCGPKCYAHDDDIRVEEFIPSRTIKPEEYKQKVMRRKLARALAAIHKLHVPGVDKTPLFEEAMANPKYFKAFEDKCDKEDLYTDKEKEAIKTIRKAASPEEKEFVNNILPKDDIVFSHNDLLQGNVLINEKTEDVVFIDYEYASYNFRGYDMGNMFKEAIFDYHYKEEPFFKVCDENFPTKDELKDFLKYYIVFTDLEDDEKHTKTAEIVEKDDAIKPYLEKYNPEELEKRVDYMYKNTMIGVMLSYYYWLIWAVKMHKTVDTEFNYIEFARVKFEHYQKLKKEVIELVGAVDKK